MIVQPKQKQKCILQLAHCFFNNGLLFESIHLFFTFFPFVSEAVSGVAQFKLFGHKSLLQSFATVSVCFL